MNNPWDILRYVADICVKQDNKYLTMKDSNKSMIRLYDIADNIFEDEENKNDESVNDAF